MVYFIYFTSKLIDARWGSTLILLHTVAQCAGGCNSTTFDWIPGGWRQSTVSRQVRRHALNASNINVSWRIIIDHIIDNRITNSVFSMCLLDVNNLIISNRILLVSNFDERRVPQSSLVSCLAQQQQQRGRDISINQIRHCSSLFQQAYILSVKELKNLKPTQSYLQS